MTQSHKTTPPVVSDNGFTASVVGRLARCYLLAKKSGNFQISTDDNRFTLASSAQPQGFVNHSQPKSCKLIVGALKGVIQCFSFHCCYSPESASGCGSATWFLRKPLLYEYGAVRHTAKKLSSENEKHAALSLI